MSAPDSSAAPMCVEVYDYAIRDIVPVCNLDRGPRAASPLDGRGRAEPRHAGMGVARCGLTHRRALPRTTMRR